VNLFTYQQQHLFLPILVVIRRAVDQDVMIGDDHGVDAGFQGSLGDLAVRSTPIRVGGVHVKIDDEFVHR
jgi:hypothetical protein